MKKSELVDHKFMNNSLSSTQSHPPGFIGQAAKLLQNALGASKKQEVKKVFQKTFSTKKVQSLLFHYLHELMVYSRRRTLLAAKKSCVNSKRWKTRKQSISSGRGQRTKTNVVRRNGKSRPTDAPSSQQSVC